MDNIQKLRNKIAARTAELAIKPAHNETGHWYEFEGQKYPSVTKKLQVVKDEGLMNWKMNRALDYIKSNTGILNNSDLEIKGLPAEKLYCVTDKQLEEAKQAPVQEFQGAGDIGTAVHAWREKWFSNWIKTGESHNFWSHSAATPGPVVASCKAIENCVTKLNAQPLACELFLADHKLKIGGTLDDLWAVPVPKEERENRPLNRRYRETWLIDLKTSNIGDKNSYMMQVAAYWAMFKRLYKIKVDKVFILHTSKKVFGEYELIEVKHPARYFQMAKTAFKLSDDLAELEEIKKPIINKI